MPDKSLIHGWALAGGAAAAALPVGADAICLQAQEIAMVVQIGSLFGKSLTETAAEGIIAAQLGGLIGGGIFVACNVGYPFTIPVKTAIAVGVIEGLGNAAYAYFEAQS